MKNKSLKMVYTKDYALAIDEEAEIKEEDYYYWKLTNTVQINRLFEEDKKLGRTGPKGYVYKVIAYYPLLKEAKELNLPELPNPFSSIDVQKLAQQSWESNREKKGGYSKKDINEQILMTGGYICGFEAGYKAAQSKQFSLEDMKKAIEMAREEGHTTFFKHTEEYIIQSLSTQQLPKEFIPEYEVGIKENGIKELLKDEFYQKFPEELPNCVFEIRLKTITNSEGKQIVQGEYIF